MAPPRWSIVLHCAQDEVAHLLGIAGGLGSSGAAGARSSQLQVGMRAVATQVSPKLQLLTKSVAFLIGMSSISAPSMHWSSR